MYFWFTIEAHPLPKSPMTDDSQNRLAFQYPRTAASDVSKLGSKYDELKRLNVEFETALVDATRLLYEVSQAVHGEENALELLQTVDDHKSIINSEYIASMKVAARIDFDREALGSTSEHAFKSAHEPGANIERIAESGATVIPLDVHFDKECNKWNAFVYQSAGAKLFERSQLAAYVKLRNIAAFGTSQPEPEEALALEDVLRDFENLDDDDSDDIMVGRVVHSYKCPLTGEFLEDPMRAPCGHYFSKAAILGHIRQIREQDRVENIPCPVGGCPQKFRPETLVPEKGILLSIKAARDREILQTQSLRSHATLLS